MANIVDLFSFLPGLQVTENELLEAELLSQQILQAQYPDMDIREGTAIRDLVIRPNATLLALLNKAILYYFAQNTIENVTDETTPAFVDKLMSNWFLTRKQGSKAIVNARLAFARQKSINLSSDVYFSVDGEIKFFPISDTVVSAEELSYDAYNNEYYVYVDLEAEREGTGSNISTGSLLYFSNFDPYFLHGEINFLRQTATNSETNTEFITRAGDAISTRNLINQPSIASNLLEAFPLLQTVKSVGYGDSEMLRDKVKIVAPEVEGSIWLHLGGKVDVYSRVPLSSSVIQLTTNDEGKVYLTGAIYKVLRSELSGGTDEDGIPFAIPFTVSNPNSEIKSVNSLVYENDYVTATIPDHGYTTNRYITISGADQTEYNGNFQIYQLTRDTVQYKPLTIPSITTATGVLTSKYVIPSKDLGFSDKQELILDFGALWANQTASFEVFFFQGLDGIQNYLEESSRRVVCGDLLARGFNIYLLDVSITAYNGPTPNSEAAFKIVENYLESLDPGETFVMSDLLSQLYANGIKTIQTPLDITYTKYTRDLLTPETGVITDTWNPNDSTSIFLVNKVTTDSTTA